MTSIPPSLSAIFEGDKVVIGFNINKLNRSLTISELASHKLHGEYFFAENLMVESDGISVTFEDVTKTDYRLTFENNDALIFSVVLRFL